MKTKEKKALHAKTLEELKVLLKETKEELFSLQLEKMRHKLKNTRTSFLKKKNIARILTVIRQKELEGKNEEKEK